MSPRQVRGGCAAIAAFLAAGGVARADTPPSSWDIVRDPAVRDRWVLHVRVERAMHPVESEAISFSGEHDEEVRFEALREMLEEAGADHSPDPRLRFDLGRVYEQLAAQQQRPDLHRRAIELLESALTDSPDTPGAGEALESLVYAYAKLDRPRDELAAWKRYIPRLLDDRERIAPLMNMGEAQMRLHRLDDALATFRQAIELCESLPNSSGVNSTYALSLWDMALALDRSGDPEGALQAAGKARRWTWVEVAGFGQAQVLRTVTGWDIIQDERTVFFVPEWDREWYLALGETASARLATDPRDAARFWASAQAHWDSYVTRATQAGSRDPWLAIARLRREHAHAAAAEAGARAARAEKSPASGRSHSWSDD
ncbi:MAG: tetratricopeptide repeat protein [Polyangiaceae bacterium]|nr:tetratricopeptide repeat protein [Polyangiaceae bacterium]